MIILYCMIENMANMYELWTRQNDCGKRITFKSNVDICFRRMRCFDKLRLTKTLIDDKLWISYYNVSFWQRKRYENFSVLT